MCFVLHRRSGWPAGNAGPSRGTSRSRPRPRLRGVPGCSGPSLGGSRWWRRAGHARGRRTMGGPRTSSRCRRCGCWARSCPASWTDRQELAGPLLAGRPGCRQGLIRARRPGPECDAEASASPPVTRRAPAVIISGQETRQDPDGTVAVGGLNVVPGGRLTGLVVTRPEEPACPGRRRKGHEYH